MATSPYFNNYGYKPTQDLVDDLIVEAIKLHGMDIKYVPRTMVNLDELFGEDRQSKFEDCQDIEVYVKNVEFFGSDGDLVTKFGLQVKDTMSLTVSKRRFQEVFGLNQIPNEGDLIFIPMMRFLFQIDFVEDEKPFYQLGSKYTYDLECSLFDYSQEKFNTGNAALDGIEDLLGNENSVALDPFADNDFIDQAADDILDYSDQNPFGELYNPDKFLQDNTGDVIEDDHTDKPIRS